MPEYFITPLRPPPWRFEPNDFLARIRRRWPHACTAVNQVPGTPMSAEALVSFGPRRQLGIALSTNRYAVYLDPADPGTAAAFALWYATQLPATDPTVYLSTNNFDVKVALVPGTTTAEILNIITGSPRR